jgi:hypothetical protein
MTAALNEEPLKGNTCFGCGPDNPDGLRIRIFRDPASASRLIGSYRPREPLLIRGAIRDAAGEVLTEIDFEYLLLTQERFRQAVGLEAMPDSFRRHFGEL